MRKALANLVSDLIIRLKDEQMSEPPSKKKKKRQLVADIESLDDFEGLAALFGCVLRNCKVIEFTSIPQGAQTVRVELQQIVDDMILPSLNAVVAMDTEDYMPKVNIYILKVALQMYPEIRGRQEGRECVSEKSTHHVNQTNS